MKIIVVITIILLVSGVKCSTQKKSAINSQLLFEDQFLPHESGPHGVDSSQTWAKRPMVLQGMTLPYVENGKIYNYTNKNDSEPVNPEFFSAITGWGHVYVAR